MKWILTEYNTLINVDTIGTVHVEKLKNLHAIRTEDGFEHIEEVKYAVVADLNYYDGERDYIKLMKPRESKEVVNEYFKEIINWLTKSNDNSVMAIETNLVQGMPVNINKENEHA